MESVEELCDSIALIHQSKKILDGKVADIKEEYRNHTYWLEYEGILPEEPQNQFYEVLKKDQVRQKTRLKIKLQPEITANQLLYHLLPLVSIHRLDEVIPTMNDIFIQKVKPSKLSS